ncbi:MAG: PEP-CTERM sorting domain-containing protein [Planctomycetota bacterium]|jgi:hypothetical protein
MKTTIIIASVILGISTISKANLVNSNSIIQDGVEYYIQTDKAVYDLGVDEDVDIFYSVTNLTDQSISLGWVIVDPPAYYDFRVKQGTDQIWKYPYMSVVPTTIQFILDPWETKEFQTVWNMMNDNGTPWLTDDDFHVNPGMYDVIGELDLVHGERVPVSVSIEVVPEPSTIGLLGLGVFALRKRKK